MVMFMVVLLSGCGLYALLNHPGTGEAMPSYDQELVARVSAKDAT